MKTIGLIGGMSWQSSLEYYKIINEETNKKLGGIHSSKSIMYTCDFHEIQVMQYTFKLQELETEMIDIAKSLKDAGSDFLVICSNTIHLLADKISEEADIEILHIADATGKAIKEKSLKKVGLMGTNFIMEDDLYQEILKDNYGIEVIIPGKDDMQIIHDIIYKELILGKINPESKRKYLEIIGKLYDQGAEGIILGCTEIPLLIQQKDTQVPLFDTCTIHAKAAVEYALE